MLIRVTGQTRYERQVPQQLSSVPPVDEPQEQRTLVLDQSKGHWRINRATYRMTDFAFSVQRGAREVWEFRNPGPGMPHPIHVHGFQYRVRAQKQPAAREAACVRRARRARDRVSVERQRAAVAERNDSSRHGLLAPASRRSDLHAPVHTTSSMRRMTSMLNFRVTRSRFDRRDAGARSPWRDESFRSATADAVFPR